MSVLLAIILALAVAAFVLWPLWARLWHAEASASAGEMLDLLDGSFEASDPAQRADAYVRALRELELDRALGHLSEADYQELTRRYERRAAAVLRAYERESLDLEQRIEQAVLALRTRSKGPARQVISVSQPKERGGMLRCPSCGATVPAKRFCGECGAALESPGGGAR